MLKILSDSFATAARQNSWGGSSETSDPDRRPALTRRRRIAERHQLRRWLRDTGIM